ncbi:MAG TPA: tetraacyldisaccharide 4'-kinase [Chitinophagales bacterium]|nr:tetraacyldisaccharide 4'-kinase [Chitinophagales bacterium]HRK27884.1 tetraacyldisaccharide 4'-kinase [Chitinophagales bacterium]
MRFTAVIVALLLLPFSLVYAMVTWLRNKLYDLQLLQSVAYDRPFIVSVGNLSAGGTGKTPHIEYLVNLLHRHYPLATLSRGYKRRTSGFLVADAHANAAQIGDEPLQIKTNFPDITVAVAENRVAAINRLMQVSPQPKIILLDDAFQHRRVKPAIAILLTDYNRLFTRDLPLPAGTLRECAGGYRRANVIVVTKCPYPLSEQTKTALAKEINPLPHQLLLFSHLRYGKPYLLTHPTQTALVTAQTAVLVVCGIASPQPMVQYLHTLTTHLQTLFFADHHPFSLADVQTITHRFAQLPQAHKVIITTQKDAMRLQPFFHYFTRQQLPIYCLPVQVFFAPNHAAVLQNYILNRLKK